MDRLIEIKNDNDIPEEYRETPIGLLLKYHDLEIPFHTYQQAKLLIGMCMDNRKHLRIPDNFAYILRSGGANLLYSKFKVSYAISIGSIQHIAIIGHNNCGMVNLQERKELFINGLVESAGWTRDRATQHFEEFAPKWEIGDAIEFAVSEAQRLRETYPKITAAPMHYKVENNKIYLIKE